MGRGWGARGSRGGGAPGGVRIALAWRPHRDLDRLGGRLDDRLLGPIRDDPERREALEACIHEAVAVAVAEGASVPFDSVLGELEAAHATLGSSMQRDIAAGREPELDAIPGAVLRAAARHGLACPTIARLTLRIAERAGIEPPAAAREQAPA